MTKLCFPDGRPFRILTLQSLDADDQNAEAVSEKLAKTLDETKPDLLLLDGDVTAGVKSEIALHGLLSALLSPVEARKIPFAHTFGDLDASAGLPLEAQMAVYRSFSGCLSESGPDGVSGVGNYSLFIYGGDGSPRFLVWCLDSHRGVGLMKRNSPERNRPSGQSAAGESAVLRSLQRRGALQSDDVVSSKRARA